MLASFALIKKAFGRRVGLGTPSHRRDFPLFALERQGRGKSKFLLLIYTHIYTRLLPPETPSSFIDLADAEAKFHTTKTVREVMAKHEGQPARTESTCRLQSQDLS